MHVRARTSAVVNMVTACVQTVKPVAGQDEEAVYEREAGVRPSAVE